MSYIVYGGYYQKNNINKKFKMNCPKEWALNIISEDEYKRRMEKCNALSPYKTKEGNQLGDNK